MRGNIGKTVCFLLSLVMMTAILPLCAVKAAAVCNPYHTGDTVFFGEYPQTQVTDEKLLATLEATDGEWTAYPYSVGTGDFGTMVRQDYAFYRDVTCDGVRYRAVRFTEYRPRSVIEPFPVSGYTDQQENGFQKGCVYWFRFDPIEWIVLDPVSGLLFSRYVLDAQPFTDSVYRVPDGKENGEEDDGGFYDNAGYLYLSDNGNRIASNSYRSSTVRSWLNGPFYETAFSDRQKECIIAQFVAPEDDVYPAPDLATETDAESSAFPDLSGAAAIQPDPVYLLSEEETQNETFETTDQWGYRSSLLRTGGTAYASAQGLCEGSYNAAVWLLRAPSVNTDRVSCYSFGIGEVKAYDAGIGIRPVINVNFGECVAGDVDGDDSVTSADARLALRVSVGLTELPEKWTVYADADADGCITSADARLILRFSVSLEQESDISHFFAPPQVQTDTVSNEDKHFADELVLGEGESVFCGGKYFNRKGTAYRWESSNPTVATVSQDGTIKALCKGFTCVYLTVGTNRYYYFVNVLSPLQQRIFALQDKYPAGYFWNNYPKSSKYPAVTETPCSDHASGTYSHCIGQCAGFAALLSDEIFGSSAPVYRNLTVSKIKIGDYVRCLPHHSVFVIDRTNKGEIMYYDMYDDVNVTAQSDRIIVAECNWDCRCGIAWGRTIYLDRLEIEASESYSRY